MAVVALSGNGSAVLSTFANATCKETIALDPRLSVHAFPNFTPSIHTELLKTLNARIVIALGDGPASILEFSAGENRPPLFKLDELQKSLIKTLEAPENDACAHELKVRFSRRLFSRLGFECCIFNQLIRLVEST